jgi:L-arabinose isomerase
MNFLAFDSDRDPVSTVPFLECSKGMARGLGYAGEGDVLTAALVAALQAGFGPASFTEIFCPDWAGGSLFLSHMGEFNPLVAAGTPRLYEKPFPFTRARNPACIACAPDPGPATLVNLAPGPDETFRLIVAPVTVIEDGTHPACRDCIRGWIVPGLPVEIFLEDYSRLGGTHHSALLAGDHRESLPIFAAMAGIEWRLIAKEGGSRG